MSLSCPREEALSRRHDGELKGVELAEMETHLAGCAVCREYQGKLQTLDALLTGPMPAAARAVRIRSGRRRTTGWFAAASLAALLASFVVATRVAPPAPSASGVVRYRMTSPQGGTYNITVEGEAQLLSIEVNGTSAQFSKENSP